MLHAHPGVPSSSRKSPVYVVYNATDYVLRAFLPSGCQVSISQARLAGVRLVMEYVPHRTADRQCGIVDCQGILFSFFFCHPVAPCFSRPHSQRRLMMVPTILDLAFIFVPTVNYIPTDTTQGFIALTLPSLLLTLLL